jgi:hypothetical protein
MNREITVISDPVLYEIGSVEGDFHQKWKALGKEVLAVLQQGKHEGNNDTTWANLAITHKADTMGACEFHRTISIK